MKVITDTATLVIYDLNMLKHRLQADFDWWTDPDEEINEINQGNVLFVGLAEDGPYEVEVVNGSSTDSAQAPEATAKTIQAFLKNTSGRFYIGPAEAVTSDGEEPEDTGYFYEVQPGSYQVTVSSKGNDVRLQLKPVTDFTENHFEDSPVLFDDDADYEYIVYEDSSETLESICNHIEQLGYEWEESEEEDEETVYFHEHYGYLMLQEYEGGIRLYTEVEYDTVEELDDESLAIWRAKLFMMLDYFNASTTVARAFDDPDYNQIVIDVWHPAIYAKKAFDVFLDHWHSDITDQLEEAENDIFRDHILH